MDYCYPIGKGSLLKKGHAGRMGPKKLVTHFLHILQISMCMPKTVPGDSVK